MSDRLIAGIKRYFSETAGEPPPTVWLWGQRPSLLAKAVANLFFFARCLSPLQHYKQIHRIRKRRSQGYNDAERHKRRLDFEAYDTEVYFLVALGGVSLLAALGWAGASYRFDFGPGLLCRSGHSCNILNGVVNDLALLVVKAAGFLSIFVSAVLAVEAFFWISYYLLWRSFAEPVYTLYHPAEYFVLFPVVLLVQTVALAVLLSISPVAVFLALVDVAEQPAALAALGKFYFVIIIANLLSMFPQTRFKAPTVVNIIGAGNVVATRMLPALLKGPARMTAEHIQVFDLDAAGAEGQYSALRACVEKQGVELHMEAGPPHVAEDRVIARIVASGAPAIIATPSSEHFRYVTALNGKGVRFAVEKPLSVLPQEIRAFTEVGPQFRERMFALSYYGIEKALPLTYLLTNNHHYSRFLIFVEASVPPKDFAAAVHSDAPALFARLGRLKAVRIDLIEGPENEARAWTEEEGASGLLFETMIHPLILLQKLLRHQGCELGAFKPVTIGGRSRDTNEGRSITFLRFDGKVEKRSCDDEIEQSVDVTLTCAKYAETKTRKGAARFEKGTLSFDFDQMTCTIAHGDGQTMTLGVHGDFKRNYTVQMELARQFFRDGWIDVRFDDFDDQIEVLNWIRDKNPESTKPFQYGDGDYSELSRHLH